MQLINNNLKYIIVKFFLKDITANKINEKIFGCNYEKILSLRWDT